ncbi:fibronectin type III domain-containing protein [Histoplasma capsulatum var. duboisii H88]|uniref:Fibronectin type III domain-containing protein n=2 Tax=Ajellomyces capsulatus (strain H88) TaxID=544711 RepID=F0UGB3_AJEC8|nr:fibronectin type III domain-containing protein [Histoplasma capsulatum var. duboisii H88]
MALLVAAAILWALIWLLYRAYQVCQTPNDILVEKLGLDIPPAPDVTLEEIGSTMIRIAWKHPDLHHSIHKHLILVNGVKVGETNRSGTGVIISNLSAGHIYHICVSAVSAANFHTSSSLLHVRTKTLSISDTQEDDVDGGPPLVRAYISGPPTPSVSPSTPLMCREHSGGQAQGKRVSGNRKSFPPSSTGPENITHTGAEGSQRASSIDESNESLSRLAERLKDLQQENVTLESQVCMEEKEHEQMLRELEEQRNELRQRVKEKDEASGDLRRHVNKLESINRTVQSEKSKRERLLQQKGAERQRRKEDITRWNEQLVTIHGKISRTKEEKKQIEAEASKRVNEYRNKIMREQAEMKTLDEDIRVKGSRIKDMEEERLRLEVDDVDDGKELDRLEKEKDHAWEIKLGALRTQYASLINAHSQAQRHYQEAQERLRWLTSQRSNATPFPKLPSMDLDLTRRASFNRRTRHRGSLVSNVSSPVGYPLVDTSFANAAPNYKTPGSGSPTIPPAPAFFNINNGMTIPDPSDQSVINRADTDILAGNPSMSPRADSLLPSDLLGDEEQPSASHPPTSSAQFPRSGVFDNLLPNSPSPISSGSRPASLFTSPRESLNNLQESGHNSVAMPPPQVPSDSVQSASRRISELFNFHRQRGKSMVDGPPLLGTLKPGQSQSFPRKFDDGLDPIGTRRRRLSYAGNWANPVTNLFPRSVATNVTSDSSSDRLPASRRAMFPNFFSSGRLNTASSSALEKSAIDRVGSGTGYNQFSPRHDPIDPSILGTVRRGSSSPRPASIYSFENHQLPLPAADSQPFGWPAIDKMGHRGSPLGLDWASPAPWSRSQSRRPSVQFGSSSNLQLGLASGDVDFLETPYELQRPVQAPIGTRPPSSQRPITPKLNPTAPSFKTLFGKKSEKGKNKEAEAPKPRDNEPNLENSSPPESRLSKDSRSIHTSAAESYEFLERTSSGTPSEIVNQKESFIQKITRKSSSSKFNISWKDRAGLFSKKSSGEPASTLAQGDNIDEDAAATESLLGRSVDSLASSVPSTDKLTKSSSLGFGFMRKSKKDKAAGEYSEKASETGDEDVFGDA